MSKEGFSFWLEQFQAKETPIPESVIALVRGAESVAEIRAILKQHQLSRYIGQEEKILLLSESAKSPTR
jgi:hypothetical protein